MEECVVCLEDCVVCLEDCTMDISELRIENCECKCKYKIHFNCLTEYLKTNNKCLYCGEEIFETNIISIPYEPDTIPFQPILQLTRYNSYDNSFCSNIYDRCVKKFILFFLFIIIIIILLLIIL